MTKLLKSVAIHGFPKTMTYGRSTEKRIPYYWMAENRYFPQVEIFQTNENNLFFRLFTSWQFRKKKLEYNRYMNAIKIV